MESAGDTKATQQTVATIDKSQSKPVATSETFEAAGEKEGASSEKTSPPPVNREFYQELTDSFIGYWWKGILACSIMLASLMAIILMLGLHQNRPLPSWPLTITLNSLVSIMVVILKSSMLVVIGLGLNQTKWNWFETARWMTEYPTYDSASNGPVEALILLWKMRGRQIIADIGLLVIVIAVAIDPFTQQIIQYYELSAPSAVAGSATIPRTSQYEIGGPHIGAGLSAIDHGMLGAIIGGFWTPSTVSNIVPVSNCITGNCTFTEPYSTVGMCSSCTNLSSQVSGNCSSFEGICTYTLPTGTYLGEVGAGSGAWFAANNTWGSAPYISGVNIGSVWGPREFMWNGVFTPNKTCQPGSCPVSAAGCYMYNCLNTYTANVTNGILNETLVSSEPMPGVGDCFTTLKKDCLTSTDWAFLSNPNISITPNSFPDSDYIPFCNFSTYTENITTSCVYDFSLTSQFSLNYFFREPAPTSLFLQGNLTGEIESLAIGPTDLYYLYDNGYMTYANISAAFANMANAMSVRMRIGMIGEGNASLPTQGQIYYTQTMIRVEWQWLSLPLLLVILTLLFMSIVMIRTSVNGRKPLGDAFSLVLLYTAVTGRGKSEDLPFLRPDGFLGRLWWRALGFVGLGKGRVKNPGGRETVDDVQIRMLKGGDGSWRLVRS